MYISVFVLKRVAYVYMKVSVCVNNGGMCVYESFCVNKGDMCVCVCVNKGGICVYISVCLC